MGFEILTQPQVFLAPITAVGGIQNGLLGDPLPPLYTSFYTWTSTASITATTFPLVGVETITNKSGAYIVTVGGVVQSPTNYIVDINNRTLTFDFIVNADTPVVITQIGTTVSVVSVAGLTAQNSVFSDVQADRLLVTNLTALSSELRVVDITQYELSGFNVLGDASIVGNVNVTGQVSAASIIAVDSTLTNLTATNSTLTNLTATNSTLTATSITLTDNGTLIGTTSAASIGIGSLSARSFALIHEPANDGVDPIFDIGETLTDSFSGFRIRYEESTNRLIGSSRTGTTILTSFMINTATGQVGISGLPVTGQALTVTGSVSASGNITTLAPTTLLSSTLLATPLPGTIERNQFGFFTTPVSTQRGIITAPQTFLLNADRNGPTTTGTFSIFGAGCNLGVGKYAYRIVFTTTKTSANAAAIQYAIATTSGTIASHYYQVLGNTAAAITTLAAPQMMSNYITSNFSTLVTVAVAGAAAASAHNTIIDGILDISADVVGLNPQFGFSTVPTTSLIRAGSYIQIWPLGSTTNTNVSIGSWA